MPSASTIPFVEDCREPGTGLPMNVLLEGLAGQRVAAPERLVALQVAALFGADRLVEQRRPAGGKKTCAGSKLSTAPDWSDM